jgi:phosphomethylpyrimidine synthase
MADARRRLDWEEQFRLALFGDVAKEIHNRDGEQETCSMCGDLCAVKMIREIFEKQEKKK